MPKRKTHKNKQKRNQNKRKQQRKQNKKKAKKQDNKNNADILHNYSVSNILFCGDMLLNEKFPLFMVLNTFNIDICFYINHNINYKKLRHFTTLKLNEFKHIKYMNNSSLSSYKYCIKLTKIDDNMVGKDVILSFQRKNERHACYTHLDFIINYQCNPNLLVNDIQNIKENKENDEIDILKKKNTSTVSDKSFDLILSVLDLYNKWMQTRNNINVPLRSFIQTKLNLNYTNILNIYHQIISSINNNDNKNYKDKLKSIKCSNEKCKFKQRINTRERKIEIANLQQNQNRIFSDLLDDIHAAIFHANDKHFVRDGIKNKFVVETSNISNEKNDDDTKQYDDDDAKQNNNKALFAFGQIFTYDDTLCDCKNYIKPEYPSLKHELTLNPYYTINVNKFNYYYIKAVQLAKTTIFQNIKAKYLGTKNVALGIRCNDKITINHIISLLIYCNETEGQKIFKRHTRKLYDTEPLKKVYKRHKFICHWVRYLAESCEFYGRSLSLNSSIYCGIDQKILFDSLSFINFSPLSTSTSINVAYRFATNHGIILELQRNGDAFSCLYFDMMLISEYAHERERFVCHNTSLKVVDIIYDGKSNKHTISSLRLLEMILSGSLFIYEWNKDLYSNQIQNVLLNRLYEFTWNMMYKNKNKNKNKNEYFNKLTTSLIHSFIKSDWDNDSFGFKMIWLNIPQINQLNKSLSSYFCTSSMFMKYFINQGAVIKEIKKNHNFVLNKQTINKLIDTEYNNSGEIRIGSFVVNNYKFDFCIQKRFNPQNQQDDVAMVIRLKSKTTSKLNEIMFDIVCKEVKYEKVKSYASLCKEEEYEVCLGQTVLFSQIRHLNRLSIDINVRILFGALRVVH